MTHTAAYESGEGKEDIRICGYFRSDYVGFQMLKTWICTTIAFAVILGCYVLCEMDTLMGSLYELKLDSAVDLGKKFLWVYLTVCVVYLVITYVAAYLTYRRSHRALVRFDRRLHVLMNSGRAEEETQEND